MNAARILERAGHDLGRVRDELASVDPASVNVWPASAWFRGLWRSGVSAITLGRHVFADPGLLRDDPRLARVVLHELVHVRQFTEHGVVPFLWRYVIGYLSGRRAGMSPREAYLAIPAEREAREVIARLL